MWISWYEVNGTIYTDTIYVMSASGIINPAFVYLYVVTNIYDSYWFDTVGTSLYSGGVLGFGPGSSLVTQNI